MSKILKNVSNPLVPDYIACTKRDILLTREKHQAKYSQNLQSYTYRFTDSSPLDIHPVEGDWIVIPDTKQLLTIEKVGLQNLFSLKSIQPEHMSHLETPQYEIPDYQEAIFFSNLDPCQYYLESLALYLQNFFLSYSKFTNVTRTKINIETVMIYNNKSSAKKIT